jgi:hypothetical protein
MANGETDKSGAPLRPPAVHVFSLKRGASHGLWQYKLGGTHDRIMMQKAAKILDETCRLLGLGRSDRSTVFLFSFSAEPFQGQHVRLEKIREAKDGADTGCYYRVKESTIGDFKAVGFFPAILKTNYLRVWPEEISFKLEQSPVGGIVN